MAEKSGSKWLMGCGIGCGVLVLLLIIVLGVGYVLVKDTVTGFREVESSNHQLTDAYGTIDEYTPDPGGRISPDRVTVFLAVRDSTSGTRIELETALNTITGRIEAIDRGDRSFWDIIGVVRRGFNFVPKIAAYYRVQNEALLRYGMGPGEYFYLYTTIYYSWLEKRPEDGPEFTLMGEENEGRFGWSDDRGDGERVEDVMEKRRHRMLAHVHRVIRPMLEKQADEAAGESAAWSAVLKKEIKALKNDDDRIPWQGGLPTRISGPLEPFRARLEASYSRMVNPLELQAYNQ